MKRKLHFLLAVGIGLTASVGWLHAQSGINSLAALKQAIQDAEPGATITLTADITDANTADQEISAISIDKPITLDGGGHSISGAAAKNIIQVTKWEGTNEAVTLQNLTITNTSNNGIVVYKLDPEQKVVLENVGLINNKAAGMILNASHVEAKNVRAHSNEWGSINLEGSDSDNVSDSLSLSLEGDCALAGPTQIWADYASKDSWFKADGWTAIPFTDGSKTKTAWTNKLSTDGKTYAVDFATELQAILGKINKGTTTVNKIVLNRDLYLSDIPKAQSIINDFQGVINIKKPIVLDGNYKTISGKFPVPEDNPQKYFYAIKLDGEAEGATILNLTIEDTNTTALDIVTNADKRDAENDINILNVTLNRNTGGGLNVNSSHVIAENLKTSGNGIAAVRLTMEANWDHPDDPSFTLKGDCQIDEAIKIAYNAKENKTVYPEIADDKRANASRSIEQRIAMVNLDDASVAQNWKRTWTSVKFRAGQAVAFPALVWTDDVDNTTLPGKSLAKMTSAAELDSLFTFGGATVDGIVWTAADKQTLTKDITLDKSFAIVGSDKAKCIVEGHWTIAPSDTTDIALTNLTLTEASSATTAIITPMIDITKPKINLSLTDLDIIPVAPGTDDRRAAIALGEKVTTSTIELQKTNISLTKDSQIGLFNDGGFCNFSMTDSKIASDENVNSLSALRCILTQGTENSTYTISNSKLSVGDNYHYAIWVKSPKQHFVINDSDVYGWAAFYMQGAWFSDKGADEMTLKATNSSFTGVGKEGPSNGFGVIVFEATERSVVEMDNCVVTSKIIDNTKNYGFIPPIVFQMGGGTGNIVRPSRKPSADCSVSLKNCTLQNMAEATTPIFVSYENVLEKDADGYIDYNRNKVSIDSNTKFLNADGSKSILIQNGDTLRSASKTLPNAIAYLDGSIKKVVAYQGDVITTELTTTKALASLNATNAMPTDYDVPDSITIICKDAYLVTSEKAAIAFADKVSDKAVFYLKQDGASFSTVSVGNTCIKVSTDVTWNDANNANRSVEIAAGATLTINVAMPLDTVFMAEGAQLQANANVTAKAVQLTYGVKKTWKAFGFPTTSLSVKNLKGGDVTTAAKTAATGLWTAAIKDSEPVFDVTDASETPAASCIIAADQDSTILVTTGSGLVSLASKAEPNAPVTKSGNVNFQIVSNPNTYDMTLTQTAYVLSADGKTFEREINPTIKAFQSFVLADEGTTSTLRSLRVEGTPTGNEIVPTDGYFVQTGNGTITIHTAEPVQVIVVDMLGRVYYNARVNDGAQIAVPAGIYAVNRQKVIVK